jgi:Fur family ferric uptake transcriptional regulator
MISSKLESRLVGTRKSLPKGARAVLEALQKAPGMLSARDLSFRMKLSHQTQEEPGKSPGLTTIYRSLELLSRQGLVQAVSFGDQEKRYEVVEPGCHNHHLVCKSCDKSIKLRECLLASLEETIKRDYGFSVSEHLLEIFGTCQSCELAKTLDNTDRR